jgi:hypothetical protein
MGNDTNTSIYNLKLPLMNLKLKIKLNLKNIYEL